MATPIGASVRLIALDALAQIVAGTKAVADTIVAEVSRLEIVLFDSQVVEVVVMTAAISICAFRRTTFAVVRLSAIGAAATAAAPAPAATRTATLARSTFIGTDRLIAGIDSRLHFCGDLFGR